MTLFRWLSTVFALAAASAAASPAFAQAVTSDAWTIGLGARSCSLARQAEGAGGTVAMLAISASDDGETIALLSPDGLVLPLTSDEIEIDLMAATARTIRTRAISARLPAVDLFFKPEVENLLDSIARARAIVVRSTGLPAFELAPPSAPAIAALRACHRAELAGWGIDLEARRRLQRLPRFNAAVPPILPGDYPSSAIRAGAQGIVRVRIDVAPDGRVTACDVVVSSGNATLDLATCRLTLERARYEPALDAQGRPVAAQAIHRVGWSLPGL